jgi:hypothetical protein
MAIAAPYYYSKGGEVTMSENTLANDDTGSSLTTNQAEESQVKTFTEQEVNDMMARLKGSITKKLTKQYEDLGDPDELRQLKQAEERRRLEDQKKRGEFEQILQDLAAKKDEEIRRRDEIIKNYTVDMPLLNSAAQFGSVNPNQVKSLLKPYVRLNESGEVEVLDDKGTVRYSDQGQTFRVEDLVKEFLDTNPHFRVAGPATTQTKSNMNQSREKLDITKLDMSNPRHRELYREHRKNTGIA